MSRAPCANDGADPFGAQSHPQHDHPLHDDYDDEDAEQPTDRQILEEISLLYHHAQPCVYGAASALNAVLQGPYFDDDSLTALTGGIELDAYAVNMALQPFALTLQPVRSRRSSEPLHHERAFLCFHEQQWYAIRRFGVHWMHLRDTLKRPCNVERLELCLWQQQADGCEIYVVCGKLPACSADQRAFWHVPFSWHSLSQRDVASHAYARHEHADDDVLCVNDSCGALSHCVCAEREQYQQHADVHDDPGAFDRRFEDDMRAAIAASLQDLSARSADGAAAAAGGDGGGGSAGGGGAVVMRIKRDVSSGVVRNGADGSQ